MFFSLEALQAEKGDSLILHYGDGSDERLIVIDGGPNPVYQATLKPRLEELRGELVDEGDDLPVEMVMVSHIDDDHINGILKWFKEMDDLKENGEQVGYDIRKFWFNSFNEILKDDNEEMANRVASVKVASFNSNAGIGGHSQAIVASVGQGRQLRSVAGRLSIALNEGKGLVMAAASGKTTVAMPGGLKLHIIGPPENRVKALQKAWAEDIRKRPPAEVAAFVDASVANLASIVVVAEIGGKKMLLTGDARGDDVLAGLKAGGFIKNGKPFHVDIFKLPHHGSNRNAAVEMFEQITADHYVISANGEHDNPDPEVIEWIAAARGAAKYTIYLTNQVMKDKKDVTKILNKAIKDNPSTGRTVKVRAKTEPCVAIHLGDKPPTLKSRGAPVAWK